MNSEEAMQFLLQNMRGTKSNEIVFSPFNEQLELLVKTVLINKSFYLTLSPVIKLR